MWGMTVTEDKYKGYVLLLYPGVPWGGLSRMSRGSVENICTECMGGLSTGLNFISVKKWCVLPKNIKIVNKNCVVRGAD